jgi:hypothetical protein
VFPPRRVACRRCCKSGEKLAEPLFALGFGGVGAVPVDQMRRDSGPFLDLGGLGLELGGEASQALGAGEVEAGSCDVKAGFGLAVQKCCIRHGWVRRIPGLFWVVSAMAGGWFRNAKLLRERFGVGR